MMMRNPVVWSASHVRHHTDTIVVGSDPEIVAMRRPDLARIALMFIGVLEVYAAVKRMFFCTRAGVSIPKKVTYVRVTEHLRIFCGARIWLTIYKAIIVAAFWLGLILLLMLVGLPGLYEAWHHILTGLL